MVMMSPPIRGSPGRCWRRVQLGMRRIGRVRRERQLCTKATNSMHRPPKDKDTDSILPTDLYQIHGLSDYSTIWRYQRSMVQRHLNTKHTKEHVEDALILTEHKSVYTLGRGSTLGAKNQKNETNALHYPTIQMLHDPSLHYHHIFISSYLSMFLCFYVPMFLSSFLALFCTVFDL